MRGMEVAMKQAGAQGRRQDHRGDHVPDQCEPGFGDPRRAQAGRAGQGRHPDRPGVGLGRHRDPRLFQDAAAGDLRQRLVRRARDDLCDAVAELLPLQHGRLAVDGRPRQLRLQRQEVAQDRDRGGRLFVPLHAAVRLRSRVLLSRRPDRRDGSGSRSAPRISPRSSPSCRTTSTRSISASAAATRSTSSTSTPRPAARRSSSAARSWSTRPCCPRRAPPSASRSASHRPARRPTSGTIRSGTPG